MKEIKTVKESAHIDMEETSFPVLHWSYSSDAKNVESIPVKSHSHQTINFNIYKLHKPISKCFFIDDAYLDEK